MGEPSKGFCETLKAALTAAVLHGSVKKFRCIAEELGVCYGSIEKSKWGF